MEPEENCFSVKNEWFGKACIKLWSSTAKKEGLYYEVRQRLPFADVEAFASKLFGVALVNIAFIIRGLEMKRVSESYADVYTHLKGTVKKSQNIPSGCSLCFRKICLSSCLVVTMKGEPSQHPPDCSVTPSPACWAAASIVVSSPGHTTTCQGT